VDDHLVALTGGAGIEPVVQGGLGEQGERVRPLLLHRGRFRGNVSGPARRNRGASPLVQRFARRRQRLHDHRPLLGRQASADDDHTVFVLIHVQRARLVVASGLVRLGQPIDAAPPTNDALDVTRGAGPADGKQPLLGLRRRHTGERPHLGAG